jgi:tetratricopeptide (TPR) repeat protein
MPYAADGRRLTDRDDSPWYPSAKLFRQSKPGDWLEVMSRVPTRLWRIADDKLAVRRAFRHSMASLRYIARLFVCTLAVSTSAGQSYKPEAIEQAQLGLSLARQEQYAAAIQAYLKASAMEPALPGLQLNLGLAYFKSGRFREAIGALQRAGASTQVSTLLAMSYVGLGENKEAAERLKPLAAGQPANTELSYLLAECYLRSNQYKEAMEVFEGLLQRDPNSPAVHMLLGEAMDAYQRTDEAIAEFEAAEKQAPSLPGVHFGLGYLYWKKQRYQDADREFRRELMNDPKHAKALAYLGDVKIKTGQDAAALEPLKQSIAIDRNLRVAHFDLGLLYAKSGQPDSALAELREAIRIDPTEYSAHYRLARLYQSLGRTAEAKEEFETVQKLHEKKDEEPLIKIGGSPK